MFKLTCSCKVGCTDTTYAHKAAAERAMKLLKLLKHNPEIREIHEADTLDAGILGIS